MLKQFAAGLVLLTVACSANPGPGTGPVASDEDLVSIGYGKQDRRSIAGAVNSITREDLDRQEGRSVPDLIRARVPGAHIIRTPGGFNIRLRGVSSITGNNNALIVMDGLPLNEGTADTALGALQAQDIHRIDVLKDGTAAIYGIRGSNGVVVIETRGPHNN